MQATPRRFFVLFVHFLFMQCISVYSQYLNTSPLGTQRQSDEIIEHLFLSTFEFLVNAFLKKRVDYSHGFSLVEFFRYT